LEQASEKTVSFDYDAPADFFPARSRKGRSVSYRRFDRAAEAIRFAVEELQPTMLVGAYLQVEDERFDSDQIRELYQSAAYPLERQEHAPIKDAIKE
jgi:hypothetical protein